MNEFSVLGEHYSAVNLSLASFSEGSCFFPVLSDPSPTSLDFASLKKGNSSSYLEGIAEVDLRDSAISFFSFCCT